MDAEELALLSQIPVLDPDQGEALLRRWGLLRLLGWYQQARFQVHGVPVLIGADHGALASILDMHGVDYLLVQFSDGSGVLDCVPVVPATAHRFLALDHAVIRTSDQACAAHYRLLSQVAGRKLSERWGTLVGG